MEERFLALTGNEFGVHLDECMKFTTRDEAEVLYSEYLENYGCASLHEIKEGSITRIKMKVNF